MSFLYRSTRNKDEAVTTSQAILQGLAHEGGLFVPDEIPALDLPLEELNATVEDNIVNYFYFLSVHNTPFSTLKRQ